MVYFLQDWNISPMQNLLKRTMTYPGFEPGTFGLAVTIPNHYTKRKPFESFIKCSESSTQILSNKSSKAKTNRFGKLSKLFLKAFMMTTKHKKRKIS
jgi:hypothetical protein